MALYLITYDLRVPGRRYDELYTLLDRWLAEPIAESVWLASLTGGTETVRDDLIAVLDRNDRVVVIELKAGSEWATSHGIAPGVAWLQRHLLA